MKKLTLLSLLMGCSSNTGYLSKLTEDSTVVRDTGVEEYGDTTIEQVPDCNPYAESWDFPADGGNVRPGCFGIRNSQFEWKTLSNGEEGLCSLLFFGDCHDQDDVVIEYDENGDISDLSVYGPGTSWSQSSIGGLDNWYERWTTNFNLNHSETLSGFDYFQNYIESEGSCSQRFIDICFFPIESVESYFAPDIVDVYLQFHIGSALDDETNLNSGLVISGSCPNEHRESCRGILIR